VIEEYKYIIRSIILDQNLPILVCCPQPTDTRHVFTRNQFAGDVFVCLRSKTNGLEVALLSRSFIYLSFFLFRFTHKRIFSCQRKKSHIMPHLHTIKSILKFYKTKMLFNLYFDIIFNEFVIRKHYLILQRI